ncbi:MAG: hypothetical protein HQ541_09975, partial [Mariniphaga sp.]|nr:hypothetical protein [Mariniphaga sp.]
YLFEIKKLHAKLFLNSTEGIVGSSNLTYKALKNNIELGVLVSSSDRKGISNLKEFIGHLLIYSQPLNKAAKDLKRNLIRQGLLRAGIIFDVVDLIAYSGYLYRTSKIMCFERSFKECPTLKKMEDLLKKLDSTCTTGISSRISKIYKKITCDSNESKYWKEEFDIKIKKIKDVLVAWDQYYSGKILEPINIRKCFKDYRNQYDPPTNLKILKYNEKEAFRIVAECIEERMEF